MKKDMQKGSVRPEVVVSAVPEPGSMALFGLGAVLLGMMVRRLGFLAS